MKCSRAADWIAASLLLLAFAAIARGESPASQPAPGGAVPASQPATQAEAPGAAAAWPTGDWAGLRPRLAAAGLSVGGFLRLDGTRNLNGGIKTSRTDFRDLFDLNVTLDMDKALGLHGASLFVDFQSHNGPNASLKLIGDAQGINSQDGPEFNEIYQLWYQQKLCNDQVRVKLGKIDANTDFTVIDHGTEFFNPGPAGYSPTLFALPTYPNPAPGGELFFEPGNGFYAGAGAFYSNRDETFGTISGQPQDIEKPDDGTFIIGETGCRWKLGADQLAGHAAVGGWGHTGTFPRLDGDGSAEGPGGVYALVDQGIWHDVTRAGAAREAGLFLDYGQSDRAVSTVWQHFGGGIAATGWAPGRPNDVLGFGVNYVRLGDKPDLPHCFELNLEAFYKVQITPWLNIKPDLQYIRFPGGGAVNPNALAATIRVEVNF